MDSPILDCRVLILGERGKRTNLITRVIEAYGGASEVINDGWSPDAITERLAKAVSANAVFTHLYLAQEVGVDRMKAIAGPIFGETSLPSIPLIIAEGGSQHDSRLDASVLQIARTPLTSGRLYSAFANGSGQYGVEHRTSLVVGEVPSLEKACREGRLILLAEDNSTNQMVMGRQLSLLGFAHEVADNGAAALSMLRQGKYGLLLTDINMPKMDGYELARTIRQDEKKQGAETPMPIIAISAVTKGDDAGTNLPFGMDEYLSKPMKLQSLKDALDRCLPPLPGDRDADSTHSQQRPSPPPPLSSHLRFEAIGDLFAGEPYDRTEILLDFQQSASDSLAKLGRDFAASEMGKVTDGAHKLKSSARTIGADQMAEFCQAIEQVASTGDRAEIESLVTALNEEFVVLRDDIIRELAGN